MGPRRHGSVRGGGPGALADAGSIRSGGGVRPPPIPFPRYPGTDETGAAYVPRAVARARSVDLLVLALEQPVHVQNARSHADPVP